MTREEAKAVVEKLVNRFAEQRNGYHAADYNETKTRRDFIDPLFTAFGWDMDNKDDVAEPYREVIHEDKVKIQGKTKAPDYGFRLSGSKDRLFFVEAKKPSVSLKTNKESAFQVRRYGWNSGASVSILTNFEEFSIYDCSKKPSATESSTVARLKYFTYEQLLKEFDFFYDIFSREAVVKGRFDSYIKSDTAKKGTQTPDKEFVVSLDKWRKFIAIDIAKSNLKLNEDELNFAVQLIIDRLIFLRFCEDRGVETYGQLKTAVSKGDAYKNLCGVFKDADNKYNSGLFDFKKDQITQTLKVTNKIIKGIVEDLYSPNCEYDFKALPVEVLGNAYEQFLGKVIRINKAHHAVIEEKPEVRKAGGVYYTPEYIVDYIVENTLGKLIKGKTPKEIEKIKVVDPACGSGSFLLGAFQYLLNFHAHYYHENDFANKKAKDNPLTPHGTLSTAEKKKILLNNIYGVDIDANAVEVTKLSLLLKCMEGETDASIKQQITMFHERVLPDLDNNIKDGNSLIDTDIYDTEFDLGFEKKIKPFSWKKAFPEVFKQGGFDAVIGNPPYFRIEAEKPESNYLRTVYTTPEFKLDIYTLFIEKFIKQGFKKFGFIIPNTLLTNLTDKKLRKLILDKSNIVEIINYRIRVFDQAVVHTMIIILDDNFKAKTIKITEVNPNKTESFELEKSKLLENENYSFDIRLFGANASLFDKLKKSSVILNEVCEVKQAIKTGDDKKYIHDKKSKPNYKPVIGGSEIQRYQLNYGDRYVDYGSHLACPRNPRIFEAKEKILVRETGKRITATYDDKKYYILSSLYSVLLKDQQEYNLKYILGVINSHISQFFMKALSFDNSSGAFTKARIFHYQQLPIKTINFKNTKEKNSHNEIVKQVDLLLDLNNELTDSKLQTKIEQLKQRIEHCEEKINHLVYELYELTPAEIKVIEEANS